MTAILAAFVSVVLAVLVYVGRRIAVDPLLGVCLFVFLSAITMMPSLPIVGDRLAVADFVMLYTILICAFRGQLFRAPLPGLKLIDQLALLFIALATFSSLLGLFRSGDPLRVTLFLLIYAYGYCCFRLIIRIIRTRRDFQRVVLWFVAGATLAIVVGTLAGVGIYKPAWSVDPIIGRVNSTFKMSGQVASYVGPAIFCLFYLAVTKRLSRKIQAGFVLLVFGGAYTLLGAGSRIGVVIMVLSMILGSYTVLSSKQPGLRRWPLMLALIVATFGFSAFALNVWSDRSTDYGITTTSPFERAIKLWSEQTRTDPTLETLGGTRFEEISAAIESFVSHPILGVGSGMFSSTYSMNEVHNTYFSILAENGGIAFTVFMSWWTLILMVLWSAIRRASGDDRMAIRLAFWAFFSLSIYQMTTNGMRQRPFWFVPAIALSSAVILRRHGAEASIGNHNLSASQLKT